MRKLVTNTFLTLDGVMQAPGGPEEDPSGGFEYGGWSVNYWDDVMIEVMSEAMGGPFDLVLGRKTYEIFAAHWPHVDEPGAAELNAATKHVASRTLHKLEWENSYLIEGDLAEGVARIKEQDGPELQVHGSSNLIQSLLAHGLIDELRMLIMPLVLGTGKRLFEAGIPAAGLELVDHRVSGTGVIMATYRPGAEIELGTFALEEAAGR